jgi:hypothetical protein
MLYGSGDTIVLDFAPPPTESRVLRIYRTVCYNCGVSGKTNPNAPSVGNFVGSLAEKLKSPTPTVVVTRDRRGMFETTVYVWTRAGEFLSSSELNRRLRYPARCINPPTLNAARANAALAVGGITVGTNFNLYLDDKNFEDTCGTVMQVAWTQEGGIIKHFDMNLSDVAGLVLAFSKSAALIDAKKGSQHQQELERAKQNRPKF